MASVHTAAGNTTDGLNIIIIGAGIAGLAAATGLAQKGHSVTVLESKPSLNEFGASIGILANGVKPLRAWGLAEDFAKVVTKNESLTCRDLHTNELIGAMVHNRGDYARTCYGEEIWNINRQDYQNCLARSAEAGGARIVFGARTEGVDVERCVVLLEGGREMAADVIIGADGMRSAVRASIPKTAHVQPRPLEEAVFRCEVDKDVMRGNPKLEWLLESGAEYSWLGDGKYVLSWPLPPHRNYDIVCCVQRPSDVPAGRWGIRAEPHEAAREFEDACPEVRELLAHVNKAVKWTLAELPPLETFHSDNGRVVIIGDAAHAMLPHSASGGNSAIEDAACISECLDWAYRTQRPISVATQAYQHLRKPRVERMQRASQEAYTFIGGKGDFRPQRDQMLRESAKLYEAELAMPREELRAQKAAHKPDMNVPFPLPEYLSWLYGYDAIEDTKAYLATL